jgi:hypothetical protein
MKPDTNTENTAGSGCQERIVRPRRFSVAHDGAENTVYDEQAGRDLFPTKSGNRDYQCRTCDEQTAAEIALALNVYHLTMRENACYEIGDEEGARRCRRDVFRLCGFETNAPTVPTAGLITTDS